MNAAAKLALGWVEQGFVPDAVVRQGIRRLLAQRLSDIGANDARVAAARFEDVVAAMRRSPVALVPELANAQHYEVPAEFFGHVLGPRRKYSACLWQPGVEDLAAAEDAALAETCAHAGLQDGQAVALQVQAGISDGRMTEVSGPELREGMAVITDQRAAGAGS